MTVNEASVLFAIDAVTKLTVVMLVAILLTLVV